jgi:hypothetical protein
METNERTKRRKYLFINPAVEYEKVLEKVQAEKQKPFLLRKGF